MALGQPKQPGQPAEHLQHAPAHGGGDGGGGVPGADERHGLRRLLLHARGLGDHG